MGPRPSALLLSTFVLALFLGGCVPALDARFADPRAQDVERIATIAFHRMEIGRLQEGTYSTNVLVDLDLPQGVRWILEEFDPGSYRLRFGSDLLPELVWIVTPRGVRRVVAAG